VEKDTKQTQSVDKSNEILETEKLNMDNVESVEVEGNVSEPLESKEAPKNKKAKKAVITTALVLAFVGVVFLVLYLGGFLNKPKEEPKNNFDFAGGGEYDPDDYKDVKMKTHIEFPGFETVMVKANQKKQGIVLYNPKDNTVFFRISIVMESGEHKGETIWTTGNKLLKPGLSYKDINFQFPLAKGKYKAAVKYECYSVKDLKRQNGSDIGITIDAK